jgi:hypothetical protein
MMATTAGVTQKDTTYTKIFVGGLPYHTTDASLRDFFEQFGDIEEAVVITDRQTGKSRGYGFVTMSNQAAAERACKDPNPIIDGRKANVNLAYLGAKPRVQTGESALLGAGSMFPFALKAGIPGVVQSPYGMPQYIGYPGGFVAASPTGMISMAPQSPLSPTSASAAAATGMLDYAAAAGYASQLPATADPLAAAATYGYPGVTGASYITPSAAAAYASYVQPQPSALAGFATYQPQQIQAAERMQ